MDIGAAAPGAVAAFPVDIQRSLNSTLQSPWYASQFVRTGASEDTLDEEFDDEPEAKSGSKKFIIIAGLVLVLLGGGATAAYMTGMLNQYLGIEDAAAGSETAEAPPPPPVPTVFHDLPTMLANLAGERGEARFLKFTVSLELTDRDVIPRLRQLEPRLIDVLQTHFRELRIDDLRESRGIPVLRAELLARINAAIHPDEITGVLLREILIQ